MNEGPSLLEPVEDPSAQPAPPTKRWTWERLGPLASKVALELFIVFIGVSAAFAVENYGDARHQEMRREAVYRALDRELTQMAETHGPAFQRQMSEQLAAWDQAVRRGEHPLPPAFRMPRAERPPTGVWDAAVATGSIELVDPKLFFELARFYNRADSAGDLYVRYATAAQADVWPRLNEGPDAFWEADGDPSPEVKAHVQRLRDFRELQKLRVDEAREVRAKLRQAAAE